MPKKQPATSVKHQDLEKKKKELRKQGIKVALFKKVDNPHLTLTDFLKMHKRISPEPNTTLDVEIAQWSASTSQYVRFEEWDLSRPDEAPYSKKAYMWVAETRETDKIDELEHEINRVESTYASKREELNRKVKKPPSIIEALSS